MGEMVERVAKALEDKLESLPFSSGPVDDKQQYLAMANAAIEAMCEPSDSLSEAMSAHAANGMVDWRDLHRAMIEAALK